MDANISFQEVCTSLVIIHVMHNENTGSFVSEIFFIEQMLNHKLHFAKTHTEMYASLFNRLYLTG